jgi:arylsulfatase A-like enzyme
VIRVVRWLAPSVVGACLGAVVAGLVEAFAAGFGLTAAFASAGYAALLNIPLCLVGAVAVRGLWAAWRPERFESGPRLAAWLVFLLLGGLVLSGTTVTGIDLLARKTAFKHNVIVVVMPFLVLGVAGALAVVSIPVVDLLTRALRRLPPRALTPRALLAGVLAIGVVLAVYARYWVHRRLGPYDLGILLDPIVAAAVTAAFHPLWSRLPRRAASAAVAAATVAIAAAAIWVRLQRPSLMLAIWAERSVGGLAVESLFDVEGLRDELTLDGARPVERDGAPHRDIILITIDTIRYDRTPFGGGPAAMPALAELGRRSAVFDRAYAPSNATGWSMPPIMLGAATTRVHGREVEWALRLDPRHVTVAERLQLAGYDTAGFFCCETGWGSAKKTGWSRGIDSTVFGKDVEIADAAAAWIAARDADPPGRPAFVWVHLFEVHRWARGQQDRNVLAQPRDQRASRYDRELTRVDGALGRILAAIDAIPEARRPIVLVTSDHGDGLGDHGVLHHGGSLYDSEVHVPLVIAGPGIPPARIAEPVSGTDVVPTLLDLAGFEPPGMPAMDGRSIADLATGARAADPDAGFAYIARLADRVTPHGTRAVVRGRWKLIDGADGLELYDLRADPEEAHDLAADRADIVAELRALLDERAAIDHTPAF